MSARSDIAELRERHAVAGNPDLPVKEKAASFAALAERMRQVAAARSAEDRTACRSELRELAREATLLAERDEWGWS